MTTNTDKRQAQSKELAETGRTAPAESGPRADGIAPEEVQHEPVTGPGPTNFANVDPENPPTPDTEAIKNENTPNEDVGELPDAPITAKRIVRHWDGGERIIATRLAQDATAKVREEAIEARPLLRTYIAGDVA